MKPVEVKPVTDQDGNPGLEQGFVPDSGWDAADAVELGWTAAHVRLLGDAAFEPIPIDTSYRLPGFYVSDEGVFKTRLDKGEEQLTWISSRIDVVALVASIASCLGPRIQEWNLWPLAARSSYLISLRFDQMRS